jgi:hypothetical protein
MSKSARLPGCHNFAAANRCKFEQLRATLWCLIRGKRLRTYLVENIERPLLKMNYHGCWPRRRLAQRERCDPVIVSPGVLAWPSLRGLSHGARHAVPFAPALLRN